MADYPRSLPEFQRRFPDDAACGEHLARTRWPEGTRHASFASLLGIAMAIKPRPYKEIVQLGSTG